MFLGFVFVRLASSSYEYCAHLDLEGEGVIVIKPLVNLLHFTLELKDETKIRLQQPKSGVMKSIAGYWWQFYGPQRVDPKTGKMGKTANLTVFEREPPELRAFGKVKFLQGPWLLLLNYLDARQRIYMCITYCNAEEVQLYLQNINVAGIFDAVVDTPVTRPRRWAKALALTCDVFKGLVPVVKDLFMPTVEVCECLEVVSDCPDCQLKWDEAPGAYMLYGTVSNVVLFVTSLTVLYRSRKLSRMREKGKYLSVKRGNGRAADQEMAVMSKKGLSTSSLFLAPPPPPLPKGKKWYDSL